MAKRSSIAVIDVQIALIKRILAKRANPTARAISVKKIEAELEELEKQRQP